MERVTKEVLLEAVAGFLGQDVAPAIADPALAFRLKIAANLLATIAAESRVGERLELTARDRLRALAPGVAVRGDAQEERHVELAELEEALARALRAEAGAATLDQALVRDRLRVTLGEQLAVINPRFSLAEEIE